MKEEKNIKEANTLINIQTQKEERKYKKLELEQCYKNTRKVHKNPTKTTKVLY